MATVDDDFEAEIQRELEKIELTELEDKEEADISENLDIGGPGSQNVLEEIPESNGVQLQTKQRYDAFELQLADCRKLLEKSNKNLESAAAHYATENGQDTLHEQILRELEAEESSEEEDLEALEILTAQANEDLQAAVQTHRSQRPESSAIASVPQPVLETSQGKTAGGENIEILAITDEENVGEAIPDHERSQRSMENEEILQLVLYDESNIHEKTIKALELQSRKEMALLKQKQDKLKIMQDEHLEESRQLESEVQLQRESDRKSQQAKLQKDEEAVKTEREKREEILKEELNQHEDTMKQLSDQLEAQFYALEKESRSEQANIKLQLDLLAERQKTRQTEAAVKIQSLYRGYRVRREYGDEVREACLEAVQLVTESKISAADKLIKQREREKKKRDEEDRRQKEEEEEKQRQKYEEGQRRKEEAAHLKREKEEERRRKKEEDEQRKRVEAEKTKAAEEEAKRRKEEELLMKKEEEERKRTEKQEEKRRKKEETARRKQQEEAASRKRQEDETSKKQEKEKGRREAEELKKRQVMEDQKRREMDVEKMTNGNTAKKFQKPLENSEKQELVSQHEDKDVKAHSDNTKADLVVVNGALASQNMTTVKDNTTINTAVDSGHGDINISASAEQIVTKNLEKTADTGRETADPSIGARGNEEAAKKKAAEEANKKRIEEIAEKESIEKQAKIQQYKEWMEQRKQQKSADTKSVRKSHDMALAASSKVEWSLHESKLEERRQRWIQDCIPWSESSTTTAATKPIKRFTRRSTSASATRTQPPISEHVILTQTQTESLSEVTTVQLSELPGCSLSTLSQCKKLQVLNITKSGLVKVNSLEASGNSLILLHMQNNAIDSVTLSGSTLTYLHLSNNNLTSCAGIENCINLRYLNLSYNKISKLANYLSALRKLVVLNLSHNDLINDKNISAVQTLQELDLSYNHLTSADETGSLPLIRVLVLTSNNLTEIPRLHNCVLLNRLELDDNSIMTLGNLGYSWLPCLTHVNLGQNSISNIQTTHGLFLLENLNLSNNQIVDIPTLADGLQFNPNLISLSLTGNPAVISSHTKLNKLFIKLPNLQTIDDVTRPTQLKSQTLTNEFLQTCKKSISDFKELAEKFQAVIGENITTPVKPNIVVEEQLPNISRYYTAVHELAVNVRCSHEYSNTCYSVPTIQPIIPEKVTPKSENTQVDSKELFELRLREKLETTELKVNKENLKLINDHISPRLQVPLKLNKSSDATTSTATDQSLNGYRRQSAAIKIQSLYRGYRLRRQLLAALTEIGEDADLLSNEEMPEIDLSRFDYNLDDDWLAPDVPDIPNRHAVLPSTNTLFSHHTEKSAADRKQAWDSSLSNIHSSRMNTLDSSRPELHYNAGDLATHRSKLSRKEEEIANEWGFKDSATAEMMMKRAKKLKYNAQHKKRLQTLDAVGRYEHQKRAHGGEPPRVILPTRKTAPKKEYFKALEEEARRRDWEAQDKKKSSAERTYEWIHSQYSAQPEVQPSYDEATRNSVRQTNGSSGLPYMDKRVLEGGRTQLVGSPLEIESVTSVTLSSAGSRRTPSHRSHSVTDYESGQMAGYQVRSQPAISTVEKKKTIRKDSQQLLDELATWGSGKKRTKY